MARKLAGVVFAVSALHSSVLAALGLGEIELKSGLNQPLSASIDLINVGDLNAQQIAVRLAGNADFERAGVERVIFLSDLKFAVTLDGKGGGVVRITSQNLVREPFLDFVLEARWPEGRLLREYTVLVDLPTFSDEPAARPAPAAASPRAAAATPAARVQYRTPAAPASAAALPAPAPTEVTTRRNDSLWAITARVKPAEVNMQQAMMAIYTKNPEAFDDGNINGLRKGQILRLPTNEEYAALTRQQAINAVALQNEAWRDAKVMPLQAGTAAAVAEPVPAEESYMKLAGGAGGTAETAVAASGEDAAGGTVAALQNDLVATEEKLDRAERENAELDSRMDELQAQIATLEQLIQLKDQQLASLQRELAEGASNPEGVDLNYAATQAAAGSDAGAVQPEQTPVAGSVIDRLQSWPGLGLLGLLSMTGAAALAWRRRRSAEDGDEPALDGGRQPAAAEVAGAELDETAQLLAALQEHTGDDEQQWQGAESQPAADEAAAASFDPVGEAEIYCSYGRHDDAIALLQKAIGEDAERAELHLKLLSILAELDRRDEFLAAYAGLRATGDEDSLMLVEHLVSDKGWLEDETGVAPQDGAALELGEAAPPAARVVGDQPAEFDLAWDGAEPVDAAPLEFDLQLPESDEGDGFGLSLHLEGDDARGGKALELDSSFLDALLEKGSADDTFDDITGTDEVATKLDLARAYMDMGDDDGARDILEEVLAEGSEEAQREASEMIRALAS